MQKNEKRISWELNKRQLFAVFSTSLWTNITSFVRKDVWRHVWKPKKKNLGICLQYIINLFLVFFPLNQFNLWNETRMKHKQTDESNSYLFIDSIVVIGLMCVWRTISLQLIFGMSPWLQNKNKCEEKFLLKTGKKKI